MKKTIVAGNISGIKVSVHWTFAILISSVVSIGILAGYSFSEISTYLLFVLIYFLFIVIHELAHALTAKALGHGTELITIFPLGGLTKLNTLPERPRDELFISIAGPSVNILIALFLVLILWLTGYNIPSVFHYNISTAEDFLYVLAEVNIFLAFINLIPVYPLDGNHILKALFSFRHARLKSIYYSKIAGTIVSAFCLISGLITNPFLVIIGIILIFSAQLDNESHEGEMIIVYESMAEINNKGIQQFIQAGEYFEINNGVDHMNHWIVFQNPFQATDEEDEA